MWILAMRTLFRRWRSGILVLLELTIGFFCLILAVSTVLTATAVARQVKAFAPLETRMVGTFGCPATQVEPGVGKLRQSFDVAAFYMKSNADLGIDYQTSVLFKLTIAEGRWFREDDFQPGTPGVATILGAAAYPELAVGDAIQGTDRVVVGRLRAGQTLTTPNLPPLESLVSTDSLVLTPANREVRTHLARFVIFPKNGRSAALSELPEEFRACFNGTNTLREELSAYYRGKQPVMIVTGFVAAAVLIIATLGFIGVAMITVEKRTREFAIRLTTGATKESLMLQLFGEMLLLSLLASLISSPFAYMAGTAVDVAVSAPVLVLVNLGGILLGMVAALGPLITVLRRPPVFFVRGGR